MVDNLPKGNDSQNLDELSDYMLDTSVLNKLLENPNHIEMCVDSKIHGFAYFITFAQEREIWGVPDRKVFEVTPSFLQKRNALENLCVRLGVTKVSCVTVLLHNFCVLDGKMRHLDDCSDTADLFNAIYRNNKNYLRDAIIAEAAVANKCTLVTADNKLGKRMKKHIAGQAIFYDEFICRLVSLEG